METRIMDGKGKSQQQAKLQLQEYLKRVFLHVAWVYLPCKSERPEKIMTI